MLNITFFEKLNEFLKENDILRIPSFNDGITEEFRERISVMEALRRFAFRE